MTLLDRFLLALCIWREARGETTLGKRYVADTILNRVHDKRWPGTVRDVVLQPWQFSSFNKSDPNAVQFPHEDATWTDCVRAADAAIAGPAVLCANHYHVHGLDPEWRDETKIVAVEGHHVFYKL